MFKIFKILFLSSKKSFFFISFIIFLSIFSFIFSWSIIYSVEKYIQDSSKDLIWADITISSRQADLLKEESYIRKNYKSEISKKISFQTSIFSKNKPSLYSINYIEENYPFYWNFEKIEVNNLWDLIVSKKVYDKFKDNELEILWKNYKIKSYLKESFLADFNPFWWNDIYINLKEFDEKAINKLSRVNYSILLKTDEVWKISKDKRFDDFRVNNEESSNNTLNEITDRLNLFIQIFYQIIILLAFFIVIINFESYFRKIIKNIKIINILWLSNYKIIINFFIIFIIIAFSSSLIAYILVYFIFESIGFTSLQMDISLLYKSILISFLIVLSWSFLNLIKLKATSINNFRKENYYKNFKVYIISYFIFLVFILFSISYFSGVKILSSIIVSISFVIFSIILILLLNYIIKKVFNLIKKPIRKNFYIYDAFRSTVKPWNLSILIVFSTLISLSWFIIFSIFSNSFIDFLNKASSWKIDTFVININSEDIKKIGTKLEKDEYFEIINSRISKINGKNLKNHFNSNFVSRRFTREFFITTRNLDENIESGKKIDTWEVWLDKDFAKDLWIKIWDKIEFIVLWIKKELIVSQIRKTNIDWVTPFFYFNFYEEDFKWFGKNYFLSYNSKEKAKNFNLELAKVLWNQASFIDVWAIVEKIRWISEYVLYFVYIILAYISIFSIICFIVSINFLKWFKKEKIRIYKKFWWIKEKMLKANFYEYMYLIILWFVISAIMWLLISVTVFYFNSFLFFELNFFLKPILFSLIFIILYSFIYKIINK